MNFREKKPLYDKLQGVQHLDADLVLLKAKDPHNQWVGKKIYHPERAQLEILWILLDLATNQEIVANRREFAKAKEASEEAANEKEITDLIQKLELAASATKAEALLITCKEKVGDNSELIEKYGNLIDAAYTVSIERNEKARQKAIAKAQEDLLAADLSKLKNAEMRSLVSRLGLEVKGQTNKMLLEALEVAKFNLEKEDPGDGEPKTEVKAKAEKENVLEETSASEPKKVVENSNLDPEPEKKSKPQPRAKPANSKRKKSTRTSTGKGSTKSKSSKQP